MDIEEWFEFMPSDVVNSVAVSKRHIRFELHHPKALDFANQNTLIKEIRDMTRKVKDARQSEKPVITQPKKSKPTDRKTRWVNCDVRSKEHKTAIRELAANASFVLDTIVELVDSGYEFVVKRADAGATVRAMAFCHSEDNANKGFALSAEAPDAWLAVTAFVYKHVYLLDGKWNNDGADDEEDGGWR